MTQEELLMLRCIELAGNGLGHVAPNPLVGSVVEFNGEIVGEGFHQVYGGPHAEVHAIRDALHHLSDEQLRSATLYVNLEPCAHHGKTPPCADLIIARGIRKVVIANNDPFEHVNGNGIRKLRDAGIEVISGVMEKEGAELNRRFFTYHTKKRPYILLKYAQTADRFIAPEFPDPAKRWISNELSKQLVHKWRTEEPGIMVGATTALNDNPQLTARLCHGKNPTRIVIDRQGRLPMGLKLFDGEVETLIFTTVRRSGGRNYEFITLENDDLFLESVLNELHQRSLQSILVEGGRQLLQLLIEKNLWDEARIFTARHSFGRGISAPDINGTTESAQLIDDNTLTVLTPSE
jgi:diaminohydroxyphosphoribosylaminopyrimidine deaminase/5-amino-6-(5-phosphoribosylamino)uracil reductase